MNIEKIDIEKIKIYEGNAKKHPEWQIEQIMKSIQEFGFNDPVAVDQNNEIIEGHGRYEALKRLGYTEIEIIRLSHLTEAQKKAYIIAHNKLTLNTGFELEKLEIEIQELKDMNIDLELTGFTDHEIEELLLHSAVFGKPDEGVEGSLLSSYAEPPHEYLTCPNCQHKDTKARFKTTKE